MRQVTALEIKPGETLELKPGGMHVMFMGLKQPLRQGQKVKGTLVFEKAGTIAIEFTVQAVGAPGGRRPPSLTVVPRDRLAGPNTVNNDQTIPVQHQCLRLWGL